MEKTGDRRGHFKTAAPFYLHLKMQIMKPVLISTTTETLHVQPHMNLQRSEVFRFLFTTSFWLCSWGREWKCSYSTGIITSAAGEITIFHWLCSERNQTLFMAGREVFLRRRVGNHVFWVIKFLPYPVLAIFLNHPCQIFHPVIRWGAKLPR